MQLSHGEVEERGGKSQGARSMRRPGEWGSMSGDVRHQAGHPQWQGASRQLAEDLRGP